MTTKVDRFFLKKLRAAEAERRSQPALTPGPGPACEECGDMGPHKRSSVQLSCRQCGSEVVEFVDNLRSNTPIILIPNGVELIAEELVDNGGEFDDAPETMKLAASMLHENCGCELEENPSMDVRFGKDIDPKGSLAETATKRYETFHAKEPRRVVRLDSSHSIPSSVDLVGDCMSVMYKTDKWYEDGDDVEYKHVHDQGVKVFEPRGVQSFGTPAKLPVERPKAIVLLGKHLGFFMKRTDDGEVYECNPRKTYLFCSPSGNMLLVYSPREGFLAVMAGGRLKVEKDGIDG